MATSVKKHDGGWSRDVVSSHKVTYTRGYSLVAPVLVGVCPFFAMVFAYTIVELNGSLPRLFEFITTKGLFSLISNAWLPYIFGTAKAWKYIGIFAVFQLVLMRILPGKKTKGPVTPAGNVPIYTANGYLAFNVTVMTFFVLYLLRIFNPADIYDHYLEIIGALNLTSLLFCAFLCLKGAYFPSSTDSGASGNLIFDYYWGCELYPRIFGWDVKQFTNCRFGMMSWAVLILCYAVKQHETYSLSNSMLAAVLLQIVYIAKFFHWEMGYMKTLDIMHDRAGFYLCWGCLVWVPSIYTSHTLYLTMHPNDLGLPVFSFIVLCGILSIYINYSADRQKEIVRNTNGDCTIWGSKPRIIDATYHTSKGEEKNSILLISGWWGVSRHFHYVPELAAAFFWTAPALFGNPLPYFYFSFLIPLLTHRAIRDDKRCLEKYGKYWKEYCTKVPYKILPFIF